MKLVFSDSSIFTAEFGVVELKTSSLHQAYCRVLKTVIPDELIAENYDDNTKYSY